MAERVMVFIDGSNFYHGLRNNIGKDADVDFGKLGKVIAGERLFVRAHYYNAPLD